MSALTAEQAAVVAFDCVAFPLLLLTVAVVLRVHQRYRTQPAGSHAQLRHRPLAFVLLLHGLLFTQLLPSLLSLLSASSSFPCLALLIPAFVSSHLLLFLLVVHYAVHYARTAVNTAIYQALLPLCPSPPASLREAWTAKVETKKDSFSIAITAIETAAQPSPSRSSSPTPSASFSSSSRLSVASSAAATMLPAPPAAPVFAHYQRYRSFVPFALLLLVGLTFNLGLVAALSGPPAAAACSSYQRLLILQSCLLLLPAVVLLHLWLLLRPLPSDYYGMKRELSLLLSLPLPLYALSFALMTVDVPCAVLLLHFSLLLLSLTTTGLPLLVSCMPPTLSASAASPSSASSSSVLPFHARLQRPSAGLLSFVRSALKLPELSLLLSLRCFHSQFAPTAAFHLSLRNPHLERIKHKKHRPRAAHLQQQHREAAQLHVSAAAASSSSSRSSDAPAQHLQTLLQTACALFALHFCPNSWQPVPLPSALHFTLTSQLQSLSAEATDCSAAATASRGRAAAAAAGLARVGAVGRERKKDAVQLLCELGELFGGVEREVETELAAVWLRRWLQTAAGQAEERERELELQAPCTTTTPSPTSSPPSSRSSAESQSGFVSPRELASPDSNSNAAVAAAAALTFPEAAVVSSPSRGSLAHLQALHLTSQSRRESLHQSSSTPPSSHLGQAAVLWEAGSLHASRLARGRSASVSVLQAAAVARPDRPRRSSDSSRGAVRPEARRAPPSAALLAGLSRQP